MNRKRATRRLMSLFVLALLGLAAPVALGQGATTATVEGVVTDPQNAVVPNIKVTIRSTATGFERSTTTDENGLYRLPLLPAGRYDLTAEGQNFALLKRTNLDLTVGQRLNLDLQLTVGGGSETINVSAEAPIVETTRTQVSTTVNSMSVANLPVNGRNFIDFVLLTPGVTRDPRTGDIAFGGQRGTLNNLQVDGADNNNTFFGQALGRTGSGRAPYQFSQDAVQEFQVNSNTYSAEYGRAGGAVINVVTKSGTNQFHGSGFEFYRDRSLNANEPLNKANQARAGRPNDRPPFHANQFGFSVGGPIKKDKVFFFINYDGQRQQTPNVITVGGTVIDCTKDPKGCNTRDALLSQFGETYQRGFDQNVSLGKLDWQVSNNHRLSGRFNHQKFTGTNLENSGPTSVQQHSGNSIVLSDTATISLLSILSPKLVNDFRFQFARDKEPGAANANTPEIIIRQGGQTALQLGQNNFSPRVTDAKRYQIVDVMSLQLGSHLTRFGADFNIDRITNFFPGLSGGQFTFNSFADFADRNPSRFLQAFVGSGTTGFTTKPNRFEFAGFFQDDWHVNQRLTFNLGIRYDIEKLREPLVFNPDPGLAALGVNTKRINFDRNNFGPRLGLAYKPFSSDRLVVRAGYGIFYGRTPAIMTGTAASQNAINVQTLSFNAATAKALFPNKFDPTKPPAGGTGTPSINFFDRDYVSPYVQQGSLGFEYELMRNTSLSVSYLVVKGTKLSRTADINLLPPVPASIPIQGGGNATFLRHPGRILPNFGRVSAFQSNANSIYHGMTISLNRRFSNNVQFLLSYTVSKAIDNAPDQTSVVTGNAGDDAKVVQFTLFPNLDRSLSVVDQRQRFVVSGVWDLDYAKGIGNVIARKIMEGWQVSGIFQAASGRPFSSFVSRDLNNDGNSFTDRVPGLGRNTNVGPAFVSFDPRVTRTISLKEPVKLQFSWEAFNALNRTNINSVDQTFFTVSRINGVDTLTPNTSFRGPRSAFEPRIMQLVFKVIF